MSYTADARTQQVAELSRRLAHACYALITTCRESNQPSTSAEIMIYDEEALTVYQTARALVEAQRGGLAVFTGKYWIATNWCNSLYSALEERYLRETEEMR